MPAFDLVDTPWIPVLVAGARRVVSVREALISAHQIQGLALSTPTQLPAVLRQMLLPVVIDALDVPRDETRWGRRWDAGRFDEEAVNSYLDEHRERFDLFHSEAPFAQVAGLHAASGETKPSSLLIPAIASGNNVPLFSARTEAEPPALTPAEAAVWLLHTHCWDTAAIKTGAVGDPRAKHGKTTGNPTGPLGQLGVVVPTGRTLFETLLLNTPIVPDGRAPGDVPQWRQPVADPTWTTRPARGLLDLLTWQARRIRLLPEDTPDGPRVRRVIVAAGDRLQQVPELEPHTAWNVVARPKAGEPPKRPRRHRSGRAAWRGLDALLAVRPGDDDKVVSTDLLEQIGGLTLDDALPDDYPLNVFTVGVEYGNQSAVVENVISDTIPLPIVALRAEGDVRDLVEDIAGDSDELAQAVNILVADLRRACGGEPTPWDKGQHPEPMLMHALDPVVRRLLAGLGRAPGRVDDARGAWCIVARRTAWQIVEPLLADLPPTAFAGHTGPHERTYRAATAEARFRRRLNEILGRPDAAGPTQAQMLEAS